VVIESYLETEFATAEAMVLWVIACVDLQFSSQFLRTHWFVFWLASKSAKDSEVKRPAAYSTCNRKTEIVGIVYPGVEATVMEVVVLAVVTVRVKTTVVAERDRPLTCYAPRFRCIIKTWVNDRA